MYYDFSFKGINMSSRRVKDNDPNARRADRKRKADAMESSEGKTFSIL